MERIIDERAIIRIGENLRTLALACKVIIYQINKKKSSHKLASALNALNKQITYNNLILLINDIPF